MRRNNRAIPFEYFRVFTFGSEEELVATFGSLDEARTVWESIRDEFLERWGLQGMPEAWWRFEPAVPEDLRSGPPAILTYGDAAEWERLEEKRRQYLESIGIDPARRLPRAAFGSD